MAPTAEAVCGDDEQIGAFFMDGGDNLLGGVTAPHGCAHLNIVEVMPVHEFVHRLTRVFPSVFFELRAVKADEILKRRQRGRVFERGRDVQNAQLRAKVAG